MSDKDKEQPCEGECDWEWVQGTMFCDMYKCRQCGKVDDDYPVGSIMSFEYE